MITNQIRKPSVTILELKPSTSTIPPKNFTNGVLSANSLEQPVYGKSPFEVKALKPTIHKKDAVTAITIPKCEESPISNTDRNFFTETKNEMILAPI